MVVPLPLYFEAPLCNSPQAPPPPLWTGNWKETMLIFFV